MSKEYHVSQGDAGVWEVRDRADVWVAEYTSKREAQQDAKRRNAGQ